MLKSVSTRPGTAQLSQTGKAAVVFLDFNEGGEDSKFLQLVRMSRSDAGRVFDALIKSPFVNQIV